MTGFGKASIKTESKAINIEIRSLNSKQLDVNIRSASIFREKEIEIKTLISKQLIRGKIDFSIQFDNIGKTTPTNIDEEAFINYFNQLTEIGKKLNIDVSEQTFQNILRFPEVIKADNEELTDDEWKIIKNAISEALNNINNFRKQEGEALEADFNDRINTIISLQKDVESLEKQRIDKIKTRIKANLDEFIETKNIDTNRFEQELIYYLEKLDITEEKVRLTNHCKYFIETMNANGAQGKKLGFISQEIGREINTMGSKANDTDIQHIVIKMKDELEKIKEQVLNIL